jgi:hypothetical protein
MSSKPRRDSKKSSSEDSSERKPLPFEPQKNRKPPDKKQEGKTVDNKTERSSGKLISPTQKSTGTSSSSRSATAIPDAVSRRMVRRMALFCGIPTVLGMSTFVTSYLVVSRDLIKLPTYAVLLVSLGWFGLGVLGLSYGVLSASWDEDVTGSKLGWKEFTTNLGRMTETWRSNKKS